MGELNKLYIAMSEAMGVSYTDDYQLMFNMAGQTNPVKVDGKNVYLATSDNLNAVTIGKVFFHPACESIMSKETEIFKVIRKLSVAKIYNTFQPVAEVLFTIAGKKSGKTLSGKMQEQLEPFKSASKELRAELVELVKMVSITLEGKGIDTRLVSFNLVKGGKDTEDRHVYYTAVPVFPFYTELSRFHQKNQGKERVNFNGQNVSLNAIWLMLHVFELAFPAVLDPSTCSYSVTNADAARLTAYLQSYVLVCSQLNSLIGKHRREFDSIGIYGIDIGWSGDLDNLPEWKGQIPTLEYNSHNTTITKTSASQTNSASDLLKDLLNTNSSPSQQQQYAQQQELVQPPIQAAPRANEKYIGVEQLPNGLFEYRYLQPNGMERVTAVSEDGRLISETYRNAAEHQQQILLKSLAALTQPAPVAQDPLVELVQRLRGTPTLPPLYGAPPQQSPYGAPLYPQQQPQQYSHFHQSPYGAPAQTQAQYGNYPQGGSVYGGSSAYDQIVDGGPSINNF